MANFALYLMLKVYFFLACLGSFFLGKSLNKDVVVQRLPYVHPLYGLRPPLRVGVVVSQDSLACGHVYPRHGSLQFHNMAAPI